MPKKSRAINWAKIINSMPGPFPEVGLEPPEMEKIPGLNKKDLDHRGEFTSVVSEIFFFKDEDSGKEYSMQRHYINDYGEVTLREALTAIKQS